MVDSIGRPVAPGPTADFDSVVAAFERFADGLVLLEPYPLATVRATVDRFERAVRGHLETSDRGSAPPNSLRGEHERYATSLAQLRWFLAIVERDDHGGNRQALGQYARVFAESLRVHRRDERAATAPPPRAPRGNAK